MAAAALPTAATWKRAAARSLARSVVDQRRQALSGAATSIDSRETGLQQFQ